MKTKLFKYLRRVLGFLISCIRMFIILFLNFRDVGVRKFTRVSRVRL